MLQAHILVKKYSLLADFIIVMLVGAAIFFVVSFGHQWQHAYQPKTIIDLSYKSLPQYAMFSALRASAAYFLSLCFTLVVGYIAAKSTRAEKIIIPCLDVLQSIPVLGFLPGLVLGFVALFPYTNTGLELAAIVMIFTGQVWNMAFSFYSSLKSIPSELVEASRIMGFSKTKCFLKLELPFSAVNLAWNSLMSMAGGWFFLSVCEAFTLGDKEFRLPGLGAYMAVAIQQGDNQAMVLGVVTMVLLIVGMDIIIWRPVLAWVHQFRLDEVPGIINSEPFIKLMIRQSHIYHLAIKLVSVQKTWLRRILHQDRPPKKHPMLRSCQSLFDRLRTSTKIKKAATIFLALITFALLVFIIWRLILLARIFFNVSLSSWMLILGNAFWTLSRVIAALILSTLWAVPVGIWIGLSPRRVRVAQPIVQVFASFPAPMLYPLALTLFFYWGLSFHVGAMFLMMLGVQWYVLFNVLAGAMRIPKELIFVTNILEVSTFTRWFTLYIPSVFPSLVTGWITAAGGAWNASIVAEFISYRGQTIQTPGLGSTINMAASQANFPMLAASLLVMVLMVVVLNRAFWVKLYALAQTRFRMDS